MVGGKMKCILLLLLMSSSCLASTVTIDPEQWQTIQEDIYELKFMLKVLCITSTILWGAVSWRLILLAKDSKRFW